MSEADRAIAEVRALLGEIRSIRADIERDTREAIEEHEAYLAEVEPDDELPDQTTAQERTIR